MKYNDADGHVVECSITGEELELLAKKVVVQPPEVVERMKKLSAQ
jgi:hypothetical protein